MRLLQLCLISGLAVLSCGPQPDSSVEVPAEAAAQEASLEGGVVAEFGAWRAPACSTVSSSCSSGAWLQGRAWLGPEFNYPTANTLDRCGDGSGAQETVEQSSVESIYVVSASGGNLAAGKRARVYVTIRAADPLDEALQVYFTYNADLVYWYPMARFRPVGTGLQTFSAEFILSSAGAYAVRAAYGHVNENAPCSNYLFSDVDDLVFVIGQEPDPIAPSAELTSPTAGAVLENTVTLTATGSDNFAVTRMEFYDGTRLIGTDDSEPYSVTWDTRNLLNGSHTLTARARDYAENVGLSSAVAVTVDNDRTGPVVSITSPAAGETLIGEVTISATALDDRSGVSVVDFFLGSRFLGSDGMPPYEANWDTVAEPVGQYTLRVNARDTRGNWASAAPVTVTVARDSTPPSAAITEPTAGATLQGTVLISAAATDNLEVSRIEYYVDGALIGSEPVLPYQPKWYQWDTRSVANGSHTLTVKAYDAQGNVGTSPAVAVTVNNDVSAPAVSVTSPMAGTTLTGGVYLMASATDDRAVQRVIFYLDGVALGTAYYYGPFTLSWNSRNAANGTYSLTAKAFDDAGNVGTSAPVSVTVDNELTPPVASITSPTQGAVVAGTVSIEAAASDNRAVSSVEIFLDGSSLKSFSSPPYVLSWDSHSVPNGTHTLTVKARDTSGNEATSAPRTFTVAQPGSATFDPVLGVPACPAGASVCDSASLLQGRGPKGPELNAPNTLDGCADGTYNSPYYHDQIRWIRVSRPDGLPFTAGRRVLVEVAAEVTYGHDTVDFFIAGNAAAPVWTHVATSRPPRTMEGLHVFSVEYVLPAAGLQAVRANLWRGGSPPSPCSTQSSDDRDDLVFVVGEAVDETPPTVSITSPTPNQVVTGTVTVEVAAQDDFNVTKVEVYDGAALVGSDTTVPFTVAWDTRFVTNGAHTLSARAYDAAGHVSTSVAVPVTVDRNAPVVSLTAPATGARVRGTVQLTANASDENGVARVAFYKGSSSYPYGTLIGTDTTAPYAVSWDTTTSLNGSETLRAVAFDLAGNFREAAAVQVTVDNTGPTVAITSPGNGATVSLSTTIQATASDTSGVTQVAFYDGTKLLGTDTTAPYSLSWNLLLVTRGQHTLTARATDAVGNVTTSSAVVVTVQ
ncbi:MAG TPA: Ig-like domain-containing protein [Myxococcaceae bacterium]|jgi:hypothetical protein